MEQWESVHGHMPPRLAHFARLVARGLSNAELAKELSVTTRTVENYMHELFMHYDMTGPTHGRVRLIQAIKKDINSGKVPSDDELTRILKDFEMILRDFINSSWEV